jgi:hypothetical protein
MCFKRMGIGFICLILPAMNSIGGSNIPMIDTMRSGWQTFCGWVAFGKVISTRNNFAPSEICSGNGLIWFDFVPPCF